MSRYAHRHKPKTIMSGRERPVKQPHDSGVILLASILIILSFIFN